MTYFTYNLSISHGYLGGSNFRAVMRNTSPSVRSSFSSLTSIFQMRNSKAKSSIERNKKTVVSTRPSQASVAIKALREKIKSLDTLTVEELRETMRKLEIPTKGRKEHLVSTLKSFLHRHEEAQDTGRKLNGLIPVSSSLAETYFGTSSMKRKTKTSFMEVEENKSQVLAKKVETRKAKRGRKLTSVENAVEEYDSVVPSADQESLKETAVTRVASSKRKGAVTIQKKSSEFVETHGMTVDANEPWVVLTHKKPQPGWVPYNPRLMRTPPPTADTRSLKLMSWNVNGLRALMKLEGFSALQLAQKERFDVLCLQETKLQEKDVEKFKQVIDGYDNSFWTCSVTKLGYSGTAVISRIKPLSVRYGLGVSDHDGEGRLITVEFDEFYLISSYVPNSGDGLKRLPYRINEWDPSLGNYLKDLEKSKPVILTGDLNCAHEEIDIYDPTGNHRSAGFTIEERQSFEKNFLSKGFVDTFRRQHPSAVGYTYWGYRHGLRKSNKGWRLDYFLASESIADKVHDSYILPEVLGSDHCPIGLFSNCNPQAKWNCCKLKDFKMHLSNALNQFCLMFLWQLIHRIL